MGRRIDLPKTPSGEPEQQLQQLYSYLYQMAEALNNNLAEIGGSDLTDQERAEIREVIGTGDANEDRTETETLKSLIIKTASFVQSSLNEYRTKLLGEYVAEGKFGKYVRRTGLDVDVTPSGITQNYTLQEIVQGLKTYEVNAKNYIKTGYLRTESSLPVYGVAIGKDVVTFSEDGTETYNDGNKVAELTADELSFWQNQNKIASYKGNRISFFYNGTEAFYISNGKIYCTNDLELSSGKKLIINTENFSIDSSGNLVIKGTVQILNGKSLAVKTGGTFTIDSGNFSIDSSGNVVLKGAAEILSGKSMQIKSGGNMAIKSGGTFTIDSGNFSVDSSGNVVLKGAAEITSGKSLQIKSGGNMAIKSGGTFTIDSGNFSVDSSGNVVLKGAAEITSGNDLKIKAGGNLKVESGGTVDINSNNFIISSVDKSMTCGDWYYGMRGLEGSIFDQYFGKSYYGLGIYGVAGSFYKPSSALGFLINKYNGKNLSHHYAYFDYFRNDGSAARLRIGEMVNDSGNNYITLYAFGYDNEGEEETYEIHMTSNYVKFQDAKVGTLTYNTLIQNSSKDIKRNIQPMEPVGEKLDRLQPVTFVYDDDPEEKVRAGLIYEDTVEVMPEICTGDESNKAISYMELVPMLLKEIQDLRARVKALEEREGGQ